MKVQKTSFSEIRISDYSEILKILKSAGDWMHINSMSLIGPNKFYDQGDERLDPDNIIWDARESNIIAIIDKKTGKIVWKLGPDYSTSDVKHLGWIIGSIMPILFQKVCLVRGIYSYLITAVGLDMGFLILLLLWFKKRSSRSFKNIRNKSSNT